MLKALNKIFTCAIFICFFATHAQAEFIPYPSLPIDLSISHQFLGKGIRARHTDHSLALVCEDTPCNTLRYVAFTSKGAFQFGEALDTETVEKSGLPIQKLDPELNSGRGALLLMGATAISALFIKKTVVPFAIFLGLDAIGGISENQGPYFNTFDLVGQIKIATYQNHPQSLKRGEVFSDKDGWNWSSKPKKVSASNYCETIASILKVPHQSESCNFQISENSFLCDFKSYVRVCSDSLR